MRPDGSPGRPIQSTAATPLPSEGVSTVKTDLYVYQPRLEEMGARAGQAERDGFDGLFVAESTSDPFHCLPAASQHTSRVALGTSIALAFPRSPMLTAVAAWDLQRAASGRFILGLRPPGGGGRGQGGSRPPRPPPAP